LTIAALNALVRSDEPTTDAFGAAPSSRAQSISAWLPESAEAESETASMLMSVRFASWSIDGGRSSVFAFAT